MAAERIPQSVVGVLAAVLIFGALIGARWLMNPAERGQVSVQNSYDQLAVALEQAGILPLGGEDALLLGYANVVLSLSQLSEPQVSGGTSILSLSSVMNASAADGTVFELRLRPQQWGELRSGQLRGAMRTLARLSLSKQSQGAAAAHPTATGGNPTSGANFSFTVTVAARRYRCVPYFSGQRLSEILIKPAG